MINLALFLIFGIGMFGIAHDVSSWAEKRSTLTRQLSYYHDKATSECVADFYIAIARKHKCELIDKDPMYSFRKCAGENHAVRSCAFTAKQSCKRGIEVLKHNEKYFKRECL
jgi:uncharacterized protein YegP (UPF0339 family)